MSGAATAPRRLRWVPLVFTLVIVLVTVSLGRWQLRRADEKAALEQLREQARHSAPVLLDGRAAADQTAGWIGRRVSAAGRYDSRGTILLDNRTHDGQAGFHVLTPLKLSGSGAVVLVLRGWTPGDPANRLSARPFQTPTGPLLISGMAEQDLPQTLQLGKDPVPGPEDRVWQYFDYEKYRRWSGLAVIPMLIREDDGQEDGLTRDWVSPGSDVSRHRGYAFQWFVMAAAAALGWLWYNLRRHRSGADSSQ